MTLENKARRKYRHKFNKKLRQVLHKPFLRGRTWELMDTSGGQLNLAKWAHFKRGNVDQAAIAKVKINGKVYWAMATTSLDGEDLLAKFVAYGIFGAVLIKPKAGIVFWDQDPRKLSRSTLDFPGSSEGDPRRYYVYSKVDLAKL